MNTLVIPSDGGKMRVTEMFIVGEHYNEGHHVDDEYAHKFDEEYHNLSTDNLMSILRERTGIPTIVDQESPLNNIEIDTVLNLLSKINVIQL